MNVQDQIRIRKWSKLTYHDPRPLLLELRAIEFEIAGARIDEKVRTLRTNKLKKHRELREAAIFCHGLGTILGATVRFARCEEEGYDFIMVREDDETVTFMPLQLKELVPETLNIQDSLDSLLEGLRKYACGSDTVVAIHVNRRMTMNLSGIKVPELEVGEIWLFGGADEIPHQFALYGDLLHDPCLHSFDYPS